MTFAEAMEQVLLGKNLRRLNWGEIEFIYLPTLTDSPVQFSHDEGTSNYIILQEDIKATDWEVYE